MQGRVESFGTAEVRERIKGGSMAETCKKECLHSVEKIFRENTNKCVFLVPKMVRSRYNMNL